MNRQSTIYRAACALMLILTAVLSACGAAPDQGSVDQPTATATTGIAEPSADNPSLVIYAPGTPSSVPVLMAAEQMNNAEVTVFTDHAQAHTLFLRGDIDILVTGLSVGVEFFRQDIPVRIINSYVSGMTYLVTNGPEVESFADLKGREVMLPFEGSPIEEVTRYFVEAAGLSWGEDVTPVYAPFPSSVEMLNAGDASVVALPEPFVSRVEGMPNVDVALSYEATWNELTGNTVGYPQVGVFVESSWAEEHAEEIAQFNEAVEEAIASMRRDPEAALTVAQSAMQFPPAILESALSRTTFASRTGSALEEDVRNYYEVIGEPLDGTYDSFFAGH